MPSDAPSAFDAHAADYQSLRRRLVPVFDAFYVTAIEALSLIGRPPQRILDLGAGTGLLSGFARAAHPAAELVLLDGSAAMLERARHSVGAPTTFVLGDLRDLLPPGPFDAVVSALAIHHLEHADKRALFGRIKQALAPGGVFVNAEQVAAPSVALEASYRAWHEQASRALRTSEQEWAAAEQRMSFDRLATVAEQLAWLGASGFCDCDCLFKRYGFAVLFARRAVE
ncbi:MAG TPA: class I SAM-dependent methyltransferase [Solirubrobacteraceae bacterium]|jgi:tRNA (cmo5U34)-methyltransferase